MVRPVFRELRQPFDFQTPRLVVRDVEVQRVELPLRHQVEDGQHLVHRAEVARHIEHEPAVGQVGPVLDGKGDEGLLQLPESHLRVEFAVLVLGFHPYIVMIPNCDAVPTGGVLVGSLHRFRAVMHALHAGDDVAEGDFAA